MLGGDRQPDAAASASPVSCSSRSTAAIPFILGALAGIVCERSGVINVAIEGQMLVGAFAGALVASIAAQRSASASSAAMLGGRR